MDWLQRTQLLAQHLRGWGVAACAPAATNSLQQQPLRGWQYMQLQAQTRIRALSLAGHALEWYTLNDVVMGGRSESAVSVGGRSIGLRFAGVISTVGGGFCSCRTHDQQLGIPARASGLRIKYTSDGGHYKITLGCGSKGSRRDLNWQLELPAGSGEEEVVAPFSEFQASIHGRPMPGEVLNPALVSSIGLNASIFDMRGRAIPELDGGAFEFQLHQVGVVDALS